MNEELLQRLEREAEKITLEMPASLDDTEFTKVFNLEFARLIVKECANHCDLLLDHKISSEWSRGTHDCSRAIKRHFGVEE